MSAGLKLGLLRRKFVSYNEDAEKVKIDLKLVASDIRGYARDIEKRFAHKDSFVEGEGDLKRLRQHLQACVRMRSTVTHRKIALLRAVRRWRALWEEATGKLYQRESIASLRNETLRNAAIGEVLGPLKYLKTEGEGLLEEFETLSWAISSVQKALEVSLYVFREEMWSDKHGGG